jgi:hypothetical protein
MLVYAVGCLLGTEVFSAHTSCILAVVVGGVLVASYGESAYLAACLSSEEAEPCWKQDVVTSMPTFCRPLSTTLTLEGGSACGSANACLEQFVKHATIA